MTKSLRLAVTSGDAPHHLLKQDEHHTKWGSVKFEYLLQRDIATSPGQSIPQLPRAPIVLSYMMH